MKTTGGVAIGSLGIFVLSFCATHETALFEKPTNFPEPTYKFRENPITAEGVALGKMLFYDALLSKDNTISCGSCHQQSAGFTQHGHALSHGINDELTKRNSMPLFNLAWSTDFGWDGGVHHLDLFPLVPLQNPAEMDENLADVLEKLRKTKPYPPLFATAFGTPEINTERFLKALSQFMLTMVSANSRYDRAVRGEGEPLTATEQEGMTLVETKCGACHSGALFTDGKFHNNGLKQSVNTDEGRYDITLLAEDRYRFKTPSLRNLTTTAPYMHDGRFDTLEEVLTHYASGIEKSETLDSLLTPHGKPGIPLTADEQQKIVAFLKTLTDESFIQNPQFAELGAPMPAPKSSAASAPDQQPDLPVTNPVLKAAFQPVIAEYLAIKNALIADNGAAASQAAGRLLTRYNGIDKSLLTAAQRTFFERLYEDLAFDTEHINETKSFAHQRDHFGDVSKNLCALLKAFHVNGKPLCYNFCPNANQKKGGYWLSESAETGNPFFGKQGDKCGQVTRVTLP